MKNTYDTKVLSQTERCCLNCRYSHKESYGLLCWGEKEAPLVPPDSVCESWKPIEDENGWRDIKLIGLPPVDEIVIIRDVYGRMFFAEHRRSYALGDHWIVPTPANTIHYLSIERATHWREKPKKPILNIQIDMEFENVDQ